MQVKVPRRDTTGQHRVAHGERIAAVRAALQLKPWQTQSELGIGQGQVQRMLDYGHIQRRESTRRYRLWEYALPGEART